MENHTLFGIEWENEVKKLPKKEIIEMLRQAATGTKDRKLVEISTAEDANRQVEGIINDFEGGIIDKSETIRLFGEYTGRIMAIFWENAQKKPKLKDIL